MFKLEIKTSGAAFCDNDGEENAYCEILEVNRILKKIQHELMDYAEAMIDHASGSCIDLCGNKVGTWELN